MAEARRFLAPQAWVAGTWARDVLLVAGADGRWQEVRPACSEADAAGAERLAGPVLPGLVDGHSHAFQRAIAGLTERGAAGREDFWSWRERMYAAALRITPPQLEAIAAMLYAELLAGGYTQVCEFHYLHNDTQGRPYADALEMSMALVRAAQRVGIGLTLLPTLYMRLGFGAAGLREDQRRFASTPASVLRIAEAVERLGAATERRGEGATLLNAGIALHSLRAVDEGALRECASAARADRMPVHIHVAEQLQEVDDCVRHHGLRPVEWLLQHAGLDAGWNLVHATQADRDELRMLQRTGAAVVVCPSTEANLGDGVFHLSTWLALGGNWSIGSDSHVTRCWPEELRLLEYSKRLVLRRRNVAAHSARKESTAAVLLEGAIAGGSAACGLPMAGLARGQRADFCVVDAEAPALAGIPADHVLDALVFSSPGAAMTRVVVAGRDVALKPPRPAFVEAMRQLW